MTSGRFWLRGAAAASALALGPLVACSDNGLQPCDSTNCAPIEGRYTLDFDQGDFADTGSCDDLPVPLPEAMTLIRRGSELTGRLDEDQTLSGTLFNNADFNLLGSGLAGSDAGVGDTVSTQFNGSYVAPRGGTDGGTPSGEGLLAGTFSGTRQRSGGSGGTPQRCQISRRFSATRQP